MTNSNLSNENTQKLIAAARALAALQRDDFEYHTAIAASENERVKASEAIADAEFGLAKTEAALAAAKLAKMVGQRRLSTAQLQSQQVYPMLEAARRQLWSVCSSPDEQLIVAAAKTYGDCSHNFWLSKQEIERARTALDNAEVAIVCASHDRSVYTVALRMAQEAHAAAGQAFQSAHLRVHDHQPSGLFGLEHAVTDAAHELTGTVGEQFAYSYVSTADLPVWQEMVAAAATKA